MSNCMCMFACKNMLESFLFLTASGAQRGMSIVQMFLSVGINQLVDKFCCAILAAAGEAPKRSLVCIPVNQIETHRVHLVFFKICSSIGEP